VAEKINGVLAVWNVCITLLYTPTIDFSKEGYKNDEVENTLDVTLEL